MTAGNLMESVEALARDGYTYEGACEASGVSPYVLYSFAHRAIEDYAPRLHRLLARMVADIEGGLVIVSGMRLVAAADCGDGVGDDDEDREIDNASRILAARYRKMMRSLPVVERIETEKCYMFDSTPFTSRCHGVVSCRHYGKCLSIVAKRFPHWSGWIAVDKERSGALYARLREAGYDVANVDFCYGERMCGMVGDPAHSRNGNAHAG